VEANRLKRFGDVSAALQLEDELQSILRARDKSPLLKRAREALLRKPEPEATSGSAESSSSGAPSSKGSNQNSEPALTVEASLPGNAASSPVPAATTPTKTGFMRRLISRSPVPTAPVEAAPPAPAPEPAEVVEWERGPDGRPRRKR